MIYLKHKALIRFTYLLVLCALLNACKYDDLSVAKPNENFRLAGDFLKNNYDFSLFYAALDYTGLISKLNEPGPFTVLAPNNQAFNEIGIQLPEDIRKLNRDSLRQAMSYHIIPRRLLQADLPVNGVDVSYETLANISLYASFATFAPGNSAYPANQLYFSGCLASRKDVMLANGVLHMLDKVMKQYPGKTVQDWLAARSDFSIYVSGLKKFGLWNDLAGHGPFTIFAPDNKAFTDAGITQADIDQLDPSKYVGQRLFGAYILYNKNYFISDKTVFEIINSESIYTSMVKDDNSTFSMNMGDGYYILTLVSVKGTNDWYYQVFGNKDNVVKTDNLCENGIVHTIPGVLMKPENALKN
jgi:uncharacterized surface protein with fasciclin (FAS1) repeats